MLKIVFQEYVRMGLYQWANDVLIPNMYYTINYNGESSTTYEQGYLADMYSWRLGPPVLRQLRVTKGIIVYAFSSGTFTGIDGVFLLSFPSLSSPSLPPHSPSFPVFSSTISPFPRFHPLRSRAL